MKDKVYSLLETISPQVYGIFIDLDEKSLKENSIFIASNYLLDGLLSFSNLNEKENQLYWGQNFGHPLFISFLKTSSKESFFAYCQETLSNINLECNNNSEILILSSSKIKNEDLLRLKKETFHFKLTHFSFPEATS